MKLELSLEDIKGFSYGKMAWSSRPTNLGKRICLHFYRWRPPLDSCLVCASCFGSQLQQEEICGKTLKQIQSQEGVQGITVVNLVGIPVKSTMDNSTTIQYAGLMHSFIMKSKSTVQDIDPQNDLTFLRIHSKKNEIMVAPDKDYFLIVIQNPTE
uniref:Roadblock/LAMTOR2 domain-containing protein n=1 Tax=Amazona collaria TaxID=241587 RepID=A0A8B9G4U3_9PSIT